MFQYPQIKICTRGQNVSIPRPKYVPWGKMFQYPHNVYYLRMRAFRKFCKFHRKTPLLEFLLNKVVGLRLATLLKRDSNTGVFL